MKQFLPVCAFAAVVMAVAFSATPVSANINSATMVPLPQVQQSNQALVVIESGKPAEESTSAYKAIKFHVCGRFRTVR
jgi:hypothetical protein